MTHQNIQFEVMMGVAGDHPVQLDNYNNDSTRHPHTQSPSSAEQPLFSPEAKVY